MERDPTEDRPASMKVAGTNPGEIIASSMRTRSMSQVGSTTTASTVNRYADTATRARAASSPRVPAPSGTRSPAGAAKPVLRTVDSSLWVPDDMASNCCVCKKEFNMVRRRHHCRTCGRICCEGCSSKRIKDKRTCLSCWDRIGRKMSGLGQNLSPEEEAATAAEVAEAAAQGRVRKSALVKLLEDERYNHRFVLSDGRSVSFSVAGNPDGLPVFLFLGLDSHRHTCVLFEDVARRRGLALICIDRPGRGKSDPLPCSTPPSPAGAETSGRKRESDSGPALAEAVEAAVVDTVRQMCAKLCIEKAGVMGQSLGAVFALSCARDEGLKEVLGGTTVALVSPWVPLAAPGCNVWLQTTSSIPALANTAGIIGGEMMHKLGEMARAASGGSEKERDYRQAPYTQDMLKHVSQLKEGKDYAKNELCVALNNTGEDDARQRCAAVLHPVHIWHGRSDTLVPYAAMRWLEQALPSCTSTVVPGASSHALMYDKEEMEEVFAAVQKSVSDARSTARFAARRLSNKLSYVASSIFSAGDRSSISSPGGSSAASPGTGTGTGEGPKKGDGQGARGKAKGGAIGTSPSADANANSGKGTTINVGTPPSGAAASTASRPKLADRLSMTFSASKRSANLELSEHGPEPETPRSGSGADGGPSSNSPSGHGPIVSFFGSGHGSSGHGRSWHGSDRGMPPPHAIDEGEGSGGMLVDIGKQVSLALSGAFGGSDHGGSVASSGAGPDGGGSNHGAMPRPPAPPKRPPLPRQPSDSGSHEFPTKAGSGSSVDPSAYPSEEGGGGGASSVAGGFMRTLDRTVCSISMGSSNASTLGSPFTGGGGNASGHGSAHGTAHDSAHGSVGGETGGMRGSIRLSNKLLPWSRMDDGEAEDSHGAETGKTRRRAKSSVERPCADSGDADDDMVNGFRRGMERALSAVGVRTSRNVSSASAATDASNNLGTPRAMSSAHLLGAPRSQRAATDVKEVPRRKWGRAFSGVRAGTPRALSTADETRPDSFHGLDDVGSGNDVNDDSTARGRRGGSWEASMPPPGLRAAGYEAAMANWPAGKVEGNPAWDEWSTGKKLFCHLVTAGCLAIIILTW